MEEDNEILPKHDILLDKKFITGKLHQDTPICVIEEIVSSYNMTMDYEKYMENEDYQDDVLQIMNEYKPKYIRYPFKEEEIISIVTYINNIQGYIWNIATISKAFNFLHLYSDYNKVGYYDSIKNFDLNINNCGLMKPQSPKMYTPCIIYRIAIKKLMKTNIKSTMDDMIKYVALCDHSKKFIIFNIFNLYSKNELINLLINKKYDGVDDLESSENMYYALDKFYTDINTKINISITYMPLNHFEAIGLAAILYNYDISYFPNPHKFFIFLNEYKTIDNVFNNTNHYYLNGINIWIEECKHIYNKNPLLFSLNTNFNYQFPQKYYNDASLSRITAIYDYHGGMNYDKLQQLQILNSFHLGWHPNVESDESMIDYDNIDEININNIIVYGSRCNKLYMFTINELLKWFTYNNTYKSPLADMNDFDESEIANLIAICRYQSNQLFNPIEVKQWVDLVSILTKIKNNMSLLRSYISDIINNEEYKEQFIVIFKQLFELGMYMRGWKGCGSYPCDDCYVNDNDKDEIENISWEKLNEFKKILDTKAGEKIGQLPIYTYNLTLKQYEESSDPNIGLTIKDRIDITHEANDSFACIRLASNYIIPTPLFYLKMLNINDIYDISQISYIN